MAAFRAGSKVTRTWYSRPLVDKMFTFADNATTFKCGAPPPPLPGRPTIDLIVVNCLTVAAGWIRDTLTMVRLIKNIIQLAGLFVTDHQKS